jgi:pimeloyl-ACP methyl ester carboxylesterase
MTSTVLYLHGFGSVQSGEKATFFRARALESGLAFCSFDFRGHGESEGSMRDLTLARNLEDVAAVRAWLAARGRERVALFGSSMGGATALWYADLHPEGVAAAVHIAPAVGMLSGLERWAGAEGLERWRRDGTIRFRNEMVEADLGWGLVEDLRDRDVEALARRTQVPTLFFQGKRDATVDWNDVARFAEVAPPGAIELVLYADGDHRLVDRKDDLWRRALAFLAEHAAA